MPSKKEPLSNFSQFKQKFFKELHKVIIDQEETAWKILLTLVAGGHTIIIGVPGLAKTLLVKTIARLLGLKYNRVQFTPDLMPSDITGTEIIEETKGRRTFRFIPGPVFTNILLADEINRTPPKTQSALLQAMQEKIVTVNGKTYSLELPFFVLATQNPIEQEGTYPLPEAQLDRFMTSIYIDYPDIESEKLIAKKDMSEELPKVKPITNKKELISFQKYVEQLPVSDYVLQYGVELVRLTRPDESNPVKEVKEYVEWGAGPRATQQLIQIARANALLSGRSALSRDDIIMVADAVLRHRIILNYNAESDNITSDFIIKKIIKYLSSKQK